MTAILKRIEELRKLLFNEKQVENWFPELLALIQQLQIKITFTK